MSSEDLPSATAASSSGSGGGSAAASLQPSASPGASLGLLPHPMQHHEQSQQSSSASASASMSASASTSASSSAASSAFTETVASCRDFLKLHDDTKRKKPLASHHPLDILVTYAYADRMYATLLRDEWGKKKTSFLRPLCQRLGIAVDQSTKAPLMVDELIKVVEQHAERHPHLLLNQQQDDDGDHDDEERKEYDKEGIGETGDSSDDSSESDVEYHDPRPQHASPPAVRRTRPQTGALPSPSASASTSRRQQSPAASKMKQNSKQKHPSSKHDSAPTSSVACSSSSSSHPLAMPYAYGHTTNSTHHASMPAADVLAAIGSLPARHHADRSARGEYERRRAKKMKKKDKKRDGKSEANKKKKKDKERGRERRPVCQIPSTDDDTVSDSDSDTDVSSSCSSSSGDTSDSDSSTSSDDEYRPSAVSSSSSSSSSSSLPPNRNRGLTYHFTHARIDILASSPTPLVSLHGVCRW